MDKHRRICSISWKQIKYDVLDRQTENEMRSDKRNKNRQTENEIRSDERNKKKLTISTTCKDSTLLKTIY